MDATISAREVQLNMVNPWNNVALELEVFVGILVYIAGENSSLFKDKEKK